MSGGGTTGSPGRRVDAYRPAGFFPGGGAKVEAVARGFFLSCFGFFFSRLLRCWPLAMAVIPFC